jgi:hypothetical protein
MPFTRTPHTRRPTWPDQPACRDYIIQREDLRIGRVQLTRLPDDDRFVWSIYVNDHLPKVPGVPISGSAATLDKATAAMLKCYGQMRAKAELPPRQPN